MIVSTCLVIASTGFGRLAYGIVMPFMREDLGLTYFQAGLIGSANALGFLIFSVVCGKFVSRWGSKTIIICGGVIVMLSYIGLSLSNLFYLNLSLMFLNGMGTAFVFIPLVGLLVGWFPEKRGLVIGFLMSGGGAGVLLAGFVIPGLMTASTVGWRYGLAGFGIFTVVTVIFAYVFLKNPQMTTRQPDSSENTSVSVYRNKGVLLLGLIYFSVGTAYLIPLTFQMGYMIEEGINAVTGGILFSIGGILAIMSGPTWGFISDRYGRTLSLIVCILFFSVANIASVVLPNFIGFLLTQILLGLTITGMFALIQTSLTEQVALNQIPSALGFITVFFAVGQLLGPMFGGLIIEQAGGFKAAHLFSTLMTVIGLSLAIFMKQTAKKARVKEETEGRVYAGNS